MVRILIDCIHSFKKRGSRRTNMLRGICGQCDYMDQSESIEGLDVFFIAHRKETKHSSYHWHDISRETERQIPE